MNKRIDRTISTGVIGLLLIWTLPTIGQTINNSSSTVSGQRAGKERLNTITTAVPFLMIGPDSRGGGMANTGVATSPDANALHWNPSKIAFADDALQFSVSYVPWLRKLVNDIQMGYVSGYRKLGERQALGISLRYFSLGNIQFTDRRGNKLRVYRPREYALDATYARFLSDRLSGGLSIRYVHSNLTGGTSVNGGSSEPGRSIAADVSAFYENKDVTLSDMDAIFRAGLNISNIGSKMSYSTSAEKDFIPINLRIGPSFTMQLDEYNSLTVALDANKLMVPSPPIYHPDQQDRIIAGRDPSVGVASGMFGSFSDAPGTPVRNENGELVLENNKAVVEDGSVFREEMREINLATGFEYWYDGQFAVRGGYFYEHPTKGDRQFFTLGAGVKYNIFGLDFSYLIPTDTNNPLAETLRFTLSFNFKNMDQLKGDDKESDSGSSS
ncbi:MAG: type IX secretion system outer membrane channel protein PorV [Flavobacteriales bacterium]